MSFKKKKYNKNNKKNKRSGIERINGRIDMDNTLLDFNAAESLAIKALFRKYGFRECTDEMISRYSKINHGYWEALERGEVEKSKMLVDRFADFFDLIGEDTSKAFDFNADYQVELG